MIQAISIRRTSKPNGLTLQTLMGFGETERPMLDEASLISTQAYCCRGRDIGFFSTSERDAEGPEDFGSGGIVHINRFALAYPLVA